MEEKLLSISEASKLMDVCENTLRDWDIEGKFKAERSLGGHRRYSLEKIRDYLNENPSEREFSIKLKDDRQDLLNEYSEYLEDVVDNEKLNLAILLNNCKEYIQSTESIFSTNQALWLTKNSWQLSRFKKLVAIQAVTNPVSLIFYKDNQKTNSEAVASKIIKYDFTFFGSANFEDVKRVYALAIANGIDHYILNCLQETNQVNAESLLDTIAINIISLKKELMDYFIGGHHIVEILKNSNAFKDVDLFGIENIMDTKTLETVAISGRYPENNFTIPIFCPYLLFCIAPKSTTGNSSVSMRAGWFEKGNVK